MDNYERGKEMSEQSDRGKAFRAAIAGFIDVRREAKLKGKEDDAEAASKYDCAGWLADAASRANNIQAVTHPIKFTHSGIKGASSVHAGWDGLIERGEIGTHSAPLTEDFAITDAKHLDVYSFFKEVVEGRALLDWMRADDLDLIAALENLSPHSSALMDGFKKALRSNETTVSHPLAKQIYWLLSDQEPADDFGYHLLQPMFSSSLERSVHENIRDLRESAFAARGTRTQKASFADHSTYISLVARTLGGSNAQNVSPQNKVRGGKNYLLSSLPPSAWKLPEFANLLKLDSILGAKHSVLLYFGEVRSLTRELADFLKANPEANEDTRNRVRRLTQAIASGLVDFGVTVRNRHQPGWTRDPGCKFPLCERLWLDSERRDLSVRDDPEHPHWSDDDLDFNDAYDCGDWVDEVAQRFGRWLNQQLRDRSDKLAMLGEAEVRYFTKTLLRDTAWPFPCRQNAKAGAA